MRSWLRFVGIGMVLGLFSEAELKLVAGINPRAFGITLIAYPVILTVGYGAHKLTDQLVRWRWLADLVFYLASGVVGLYVEWTLLGNDLQSNAFQPGMFAMWTTFLFGPRILTREAPSLRGPRRWFWRVFIVLAVVLTLLIGSISDYDARVVIAVWALSAVYLVWSLWLLALAWHAKE